MNYNYNLLYTLHTNTWKIQVNRKQENKKKESHKKFNNFFVWLKASICSFISLNFLNNLIWYFMSGKMVALITIIFVYTKKKN